jgi:hypothetical protein
MSNDYKFDLERFRKSEGRKYLFWNLVYYFNEHGLPFDFILPYQNYQEKKFDEEHQKYKRAQEKEFRISYTEEAFEREYQKFIKDQ